MAQLGVLMPEAKIAFNSMIKTPSRLLHDVPQSATRIRRVSWNSMELDVV
jgi:hypothetical protein